MPGTIWVDFTRHGASFRDDCKREGRVMRVKYLHTMVRVADLEKSIAFFEAEIHQSGQCETTVIALGQFREICCGNGV